MYDIPHRFMTRDSGIARVPPVWSELKGRGCGRQNGRRLVALVTPGCGSIRMTRQTGEQSPPSVAQVRSDNKACSNCANLDAGQRPWACLQEAGFVLIVAKIGKYSLESVPPAGSEFS
jgi:hypothetical protein